MSNGDGLESAVIDTYVMAAIEFGRNCDSELSDAAFRRLREVFDFCVAPIVVQSYGEEWFAKYLRFIRRSSGEMGRALTSRAREGRIGAEMVDAAGHELLRDWERSCPVEFPIPNFKMVHPEADEEKRPFECIRARELFDVREG